MSRLSVFIDESGDFGSYEHHAPYYIITLVAYCSFFGVTFRSPSVYRSISHRCVLACGTGADGAHDRVHTGDFAVLGLT